MFNYSATVQGSVSLPHDDDYRTLEVRPGFSNLIIIGLSISTLFSGISEKDEDRSKSTKVTKEVMSDGMS